MADSSTITLLSRLEEINEHVIDLINDVKKKEDGKRSIIPNSVTSKKLGDIDARIWSIYHDIIGEGELK